MNINNTQISIYIYIRSQLVEHGLSMFLQEKKHRYNVTVGITSFNQLISKIKDNVPDIVIIEYEAMDIKWDLLYELNEAYKNMKVMILNTTTNLTDDILVEHISRGIKGWITQDVQVKNLYKAIEQVNNGELWIERRLFSRLVSRLLTDSKSEIRNLSRSTLSKREQEILELIIRGDKNKEIANFLYISESTVKSHLSNIFRKLGIKNRRQLFKLTNKQQLKKY